MSKLNRVLVVDDDPIVTKSFERSLPKTEYAVITASSGAEALEKLGKEEYDLVFTDIKMPNMSGLELTEQIKAKNKWTPVVIITGFGSQENQNKAQELGVSDFIQKPLSPDAIKLATEHAIHPHVENEIVPQEVVKAIPNRLKGIALFFAAPFFGLAYALALPFVGLGMLAYVGGKRIFK